MGVNSWQSGPNSTSVPITLPERLDLTAEELLATLREAVATGALVLDGGAVTRVDAAGLQLLCAAVAAATGHVVWQRPSTVLREGAALLGLTAALRFEGQR